MGNRPMWFSGEGWQSALDSPAAISIMHLKALFTSRPWFELVPDQAHTVSTSGYGDPNGLDYAISGHGTSTHLAGIRMGMVGGFKMNPIPYRGSGPALTDVIGGQAQFLVVDLASARPHLKSGRLRALAVTTSKRTGLAPELPTIEESLGLQDFDLAAWIASRVRAEQGIRSLPACQRPDEEVFGASLGCIKGPCPALKTR